MKISDYAVKNYQFTLVIFVMIAVLGFTTVMNMPRSEDPEMHAPFFPVVVIYPGASPEDIEELVVDPIETEIYALDNVIRIRTNITDGVAVIRVEYAYSSDVETKYQELIRVVNGMRDELPPDIYSIEVNKFQPSDVNIIQAAFISENAPRDQLKFYAEKLQDELEKLPQLKNIEIHGLPEQQVRVELYLEKLASLHIPAEAILGNLQNEMSSIPGGNIDAGSKSFNVTTSANFESIEDIKKAIVYSVNGKNYRLEDLAKVYYGYENNNYKTRLNGHRSIVLVAAQKEGNNISQTQEAYLPLIENFKEQLPPNIDLIQNFDQADNVNKRLSGLGIDFLIAILLVAFTLMPLGGRPALIVMISIPLSLAIGIILLDVMGYNLNQLSIVGLVVALGLLVDDSIVVVENIERWMLEGHSRMDATIKATKQIGLAIVGCTITLIIAFMPLAFMPESSGDFIRSMPLAVIFSVLASMLVSLTIIPFLASRMLKNHVNPEGNIFMRGLKKGIHKSYAPLLDRALNRPVGTLVIAVAIFAGSLLVLKMVGFSLFPASEKPQFMVNITTPPQSNIPYTDSIARDVEKQLLNEASVKFVSSNIGKGNPRIYYNESVVNERSNFAQLFIQLNDDTPASEKQELISNLRKRWTPYPGAEIEVKNFEQGPPVVAPIEVKLMGENLDSLSVLAGRIEQLISNTEGTIYVENPVEYLQTDIRLDVNKEKARMLGVPGSNIDRTVRLAIAGINLGEYSDINGNDYDILVTRTKEARPTLSDLDNLYVTNNKGAAVPLNQIATTKLEAGQLVISHQEKNRVVSVSAFVKDGFLVDDVLNNVINQMNEYDLPQGYTFEMGGEIESRERSFGGFLNIIIVTAFLFIAVLILEFGTFKSTLIVLSVIPLGIVGAALALWITGNTLSFVAIIGLIALAGIEVKNTILLVDFTNQLRKEGKSLEEAIREAGEIRFLPIVLTSLTAIGGLIPIAISHNPLISPLAIVLIGGLISSTLLSRVVTPVVYKLMPPRVK